MKKRMLFLALAAASLFTVTACSADQPSAPGSATQSEASVPQEPPELKLSVDMKQGDSTVQIPEFVSPGDNPETRALNDKIQENHTNLYEEWKSTANSVRQLEVKTYPFANDRYVQAVVTQLEFPTFGTQGDVFSYNYDIKNHKAITLAEAIAMSNGKFQHTEASLLSGLTIANLPEQVTMERAELKGFRILDNGHIDCYAKVHFSQGDAEEGKYDMIYTLHLDPSSETVTNEPYNGETLIPSAEPTASSTPISSAS